MILRILQNRTLRRGLQGHQAMQGHGCDRTIHRRLDLGRIPVLAGFLEVGVDTPRRVVPAQPYERHVDICTTNESNYL